MLYRSHFNKMLMLSHMLEDVLKGPLTKVDILEVIDIVETIRYADTVDCEVGKHSLRLVVTASILGAIRQHINKIGFVVNQDSLVQIPAVATANL